MKKIYKPKEWVEKEIKHSKEGWFTWSRQDQLCLDMAFQLYRDYDEEYQTKEGFEDCIQHATELLTVFYNYKYNPKTRRV